MVLVVFMAAPPQDCYFPLGTLAEQITYPDSAEGIDAKRAVQLLQVASAWQREEGREDGRRGVGGRG